MDQEKVGKFINELRKERNMTQEELAEKMGVTSKSISRWENGKTMPDISMLSPLAEFLGISVQELLNGRKMSKEKLLELKGTIENLIAYESSQQMKKESKTNKYIVLGNSILIVALLSSTFGFLGFIFSEDVIEFLYGFLFSLGITLNLCGVYNNSHDLSICVRKKALLNKWQKK